MTAEAAEQTLTLPNGRKLSYAEYGDPLGQPGFYFHGHPGSRLEAELAHKPALERGLRIIAIDRPGYGRSDFQPNRRILDWPGDVAAAADALGIDTFAVLGASGGGPYALACGFALARRVTRVGVVSGVGPYNLPHATDGMRWQNRLGFQLGARWPWLASLIMRSMSRQVRRSPERTVDAVAAAMSGADAEAVQRPDVRTLLAADLKEAFRQGHRGPALDVVLLGRPWGFALEAIGVPVLLWQGEADVLVPPGMARLMAQRIPNCRAQFFPGEGHLLVLQHMAQILDEFIPPANGRAEAAIDPQ
jgi:pimeloyl-ACP methyl ester carboxylesterase